MFDELFKEPATIEKYQAAPLAQERLWYLRHLEGTGAKQKTLRNMAMDQLSLVRLLTLREGDTVSLSQVESAAREWSRPTPARHHKPARTKQTAVFAGHAVQWLRFLGCLEEPEEVPHPHMGEVAAYVEWMRGERGLSEASIRAYRIGADEFFDWLSAMDMPLSSVTLTDLDRAIAAKNARSNCSRTTIKLYAERLRAFFRFAEDRRWCRPGIASAIRPQRIYPDQNVPARLTRDDIWRLLATTEGDRPVDRRDHAILMLLIAYGLRAGEVSGLDLEDLDWEAETLRVRRSKRGGTHLYPLSRGVGQTILHYLLKVRPSRPERALFFTLAAPLRRLSPIAISHTVRRRVDRLDIDVKRRGPHTLRHAAAQHLLDQGMSMKVVGDFLGHRDPSSTAVYAKVNLNALREVANFDLEGLV